MELIDLANIGLPDIVKLTDRISYVPASMNPLSSDIGIIYGDSRVYLYDVGSSLPALKLLGSLPDNKSIVISHFHGDHTWWLTDHKHGEHGVAVDDNISTRYERPSYSSLYVSSLSARYTARISPAESYDRSGLDDTEFADSNTDAEPNNVIVSSPLHIEDGVKLDIIPIPCTHCKGSLILSVDDTWCFLGDSTYPNKVNDVTFYNAQLLQAEIKLLEGLKAEYFFLSHDRKFIRPKKVVLRQLKSIYDSWDKTDSLIRI